ncbi:MAG: hypothetical protein IKE51_04870 [Solobacterium sp.]|nr:hypothetical protein [Solobacterium sp.]
MSLRIIMIEMIVFALFFTMMVFYIALKRKDTIANIHNYPPDIQEEYFKTHDRVDTSHRSKSVILAKSLGILIFTVILVICAKVAEAKTFWEGFIIAFGLMVWIGIYDTCFLDWVLFANMKIFRLRGTEHMDEAYHQKMFHVKGMIFPGLLYAILCSMIVGWLITIM